MLIIKLKWIFAVTLIITLFFTLSLVSASDSNMDDNIALNDDNNIKTISDNDDFDVGVQENKNNEVNTLTSPSKDYSNNEMKSNNEVLNFSNLNDTINSNSGEIKLVNDYAFDNNFDSRFISLGGIILENDIVIDGQGHTIDCGGKLRFLNNTGHIITLKNIIIKNGLADYGGGIYIENGNGSIINSNFTSNNGLGSGGAIYLENANINFNNCTFDSNSASRYSGAVHIIGNCIFNNTKFLNNNASMGGACYITRLSLVNFLNSTFRSNNAEHYGAVMFAGNGSFIDSSFISNIASSGTGGAVFFGGNTNFTNCNFTSNIAKDSGGAVCVSGNGTFINNRFIDNFANQGGALSYFNSFAGTNIIDSTFTGNNASIGGAIFTEDGFLNLTESIFKNNVGNIVYNNISDNIFVDNFTINNSDPDLIRKYSLLVVQINNYTYGSIGYILCNLSSSNITDLINGTVYVKIANETYIGNIINGTGQIELKDLSVGNYNISVIYNGSSIYSKSIALSSFTVFKRNSNMNVTVDNITYGDNVLFNITTDCPDSVVFLEIGGVVYATNLTGGKGIINITGLHAGVYDLNVTYNGTDEYYPCVILVSFNVFKSNSTINVSADDVTYGDDVLINVSTDCPDSLVFVEIDGVVYATNLTGGKGIIRITGLHAGDYNLNVTYNGTEDYYPCIESVNFTIFKSNSTINVSAEDVLLGDNVLINVSTDCPDSLVYVEIDGVVYSTNLTDGQGLINISGLHTGHYDLNVTYNGTDDYYPCVMLVSFNVFKSNSTINVSVDDVTYGEDVLINVSTDCPDSLVFVEIDGVVYATNLTGGKGIIRITGLHAGDYNLNVTYNGTDDYAPCKKLVNFTVNKQSIKINAKTATYIVNYGGLYTVTVNPKIAGLKVSFTLNGKNIGTVTTDKSGTAKINIKASALKKCGAGTRTLSVIFAGDKDHIKSNVKVKIKINKEATKLLNVKSVKKSYKTTAKSMQLTATLKNSKNKVIKYQIVYFKINKKTFKVKTNPKGVAKLTLKKAQIKACKLNKKGTYRFTVTYKTTGTYKQSNKNGLIKVIK